MFGDKKHKEEDRDPEDPLSESMLEPDQAEKESEHAPAKEGPKKDRPITIKESEYHKLASDAAEYKDKYMRLFAEFDNARKRMEREKGEFVKYANEGLIAEFLEIVDDLERSVAAAKVNHQDYAAFLKGIELVMARIHEMLKKNSVKPIVSVGKTFDPHCHEALMQSETDEHKEGTIVEEFQKGYMYGDRVVRTAKVKVAKQKQDGQEEVQGQNQ